MQNAGSFATEINNAMAPTVAAQRQAIQQLGPTLDSQNNFLNLVEGPQSTCGGRKCGIDEVFTGTLLGNINYPNDQLTVSSTQAACSPPLGTSQPGHCGGGELVTLLWD